MLFTVGIASASDTIAPGVNESFKPQVWEYPVLPKILFGTDNGQCVNYARQLSGINYSGNAITWSAFVVSQRPNLGSVVVFDESVNLNGHLAVVVALYENYFIVSERNYEGLYIVSERKVDYNDSTILGFIKEVEEINLTFDIKNYVKIR